LEEAKVFGGGGKTHSGRRLKTSEEAKQAKVF
jgi:hypothetical protein